MSPIALFVFNRPAHTRRTLQCLAQADGAAQSDLHIFADGARSAADEAAVREVRDICRAATGFASVTLTERERNYGLAANIIGGVTQVIGIKGTVIVIEDDVNVAPFFLKYMNAALDFYRGRGVFSIGGYTPDIQIPADYPFSTFVMYRNCSWGWATWKSQWEKINWKIPSFDKFIRNSALRHQFDAPGDDMTPFLLRYKTGAREMWDIVFSYTAFKYGEPHVYPRKSLVRNDGNDGSGTHVASTTKYDAPLATSISTSNFCPGVAPFPSIVAEFHRFYSTSTFRRAVNTLKR
ncbi:hypothetical protein NP234_24110, partial [Salmonella enterica]|nr:hypothetical protein [Salmonella enterica]